MSTVASVRIEKSPDICGGQARVAGTRIPVWTLVWYRRSGLSDERLRESYPSLTAPDLEACWNYYQHNANEVEQSIWLNEVAANVPVGVPPPSWVIVAGLRLGVPEAEIREAFEPELTAHDLSAAWADYWNNPADIEQDLARCRQAG